MPNSNIEFGRNQSIDAQASIRATSVELSLLPGDAAGECSFEIFIAGSGAVIVGHADGESLRTAKKVRSQKVANKSATIY